MPDTPPARSSRRPWRLALFLVVALASGIVLADWWRCLPEDAVASYVGRSKCASCHTTEAERFTGSHHDLAMDEATPETVLGDFEDAELEHHGLRSRMFRRDGKYWVRTDGPDGEPAEFEIKYVFGVEPLQQYLVEVQAAGKLTSVGANSAVGSTGVVGRLQVLRETWDSRDHRWYYLSPPDVDERLAPDDDLHWTGVAQRWNTMCADCHSTNLQKGFDVATDRYHTTFSEIDVSCEACHGPGGLHVQLAERRSLFWDRKRGYGLRPIHATDGDNQLDACAPCHARRAPLREPWMANEPLAEQFTLELLRPQTYYCDGQIRDEVYELGSFLQSKMYHKGIRCSDCHDPHSARLKYEGNQVCTSCHQHQPAKYDTPAHHHHQPGSSGALCANCHMPTTTYMEVDPRRDHSLRVPRPDLSVTLGTPNACVACHVDLPAGTTTAGPSTASAESGASDGPLGMPYQDAMVAAHPIDGVPADERALGVLGVWDAWAERQVREWYPESQQRGEHFATALHQAWESPRAAWEAVRPLLGSRATPAIVRASALDALREAPLEEVPSEVEESLTDPHPLVRAAAVSVFEQALLSSSPERLSSVVRPLLPLLSDPAASVRVEAARVLANVPPGRLRPMLDNDARAALLDAIAELERAMEATADRGGAHAALGSLHEMLGDEQRAEQDYRAAIRIAPGMPGPRTNLAAVLERRVEELTQELQRMAQQRAAPELAEPLIERASRYDAEAAELRAAELPLIERDASLAPHNADLQHRLGLALYLAGRLDDAEDALRRAVELAPGRPRYLQMLALLEQKRGKFREALRHAEQLLELEPDSPEHRALLNELQGQLRDAAPIGPSRDQGSGIRGEE